MVPRPRAILFDMDGLMIDSEPLWLEVEDELARAWGGTWTEADARRCIGGGLTATARAMAAKLGRDVTAEAGVAELVARFRGKVERLGLKPGCRELIAAARAAGVPIAVASSNVRTLVDAVLGRFALAPLFDTIVTGDDVARPKPAPDIFLEAARRLGVAPADALVLEDAPNGARAGRAAGMRVVLVPEPGTVVDVEVDWVMPDLIAVRALLGW